MILLTVLLEMSLYHVGPFELGQIKAHMEHGLGCGQIRDRVKKGDGKTLFSERAIVTAMNNLRDNPHFRGERAKGSGRPRKTTKKQACLDKNAQNDDEKDDQEDDERDDQEDDEKTSLPRQKRPK